MAEADEAVCSDNLTGLTLSKALMKDPIGFVPAPNWIPEILEQLDQSPDSEQTSKRDSFGDGRQSHGGLKTGQPRALCAKQSLVHRAE